MDRITLDQLQQTFLERHSGWCVSLFMPTHRSGRETEQNPIRFKNLLRQVEERLLAKDLRSAEVQSLLKDLHQLLQDEEFWRYQSDGLAVFFSEDALQFFRLPVHFAELVVITDRFHIKPLLPLLTSDGTFYILALSKKRLRLLEGTRYSVDEITLENVPDNLAETFPEDSPERQLQFHTGTHSGSGSRPAVFHGHDFSNDAKVRIQQWFRNIDKVVLGVLPDRHCPLVLAGVDTLFSLYRDVNSYPHLMDEGISGNPDDLRPEQLHKKAWAIVEPVFNRDREAEYARYQQFSGTDQTTTEVEGAVRAAHQGRIDVLFVAVGVQIWGGFDSGNDQVIVHRSPEPGDEDLLDLAAITTLIKGGTVYAVPPEKVPGRASLAAILRY